MREDRGSTTENCGSGKNGSKKATLESALYSALFADYFIGAICVEIYELLTIVLNSFLCLMIVSNSDFY